MAGKDGGSEKFMIAYGSSHSSTPNMLALKSNDNGSGSVGFFTNSTERARFDVNGRLIKTEDLKDGIPINISNLESGQYMVKIQTETEVYIQSFIKSK